MTSHAILREEWKYGRQGGASRACENLSEPNIGMSGAQEYRSKTSGTSCLSPGIRSCNIFCFNSLRPGMTSTRGIRIPCGRFPGTSRCVGTKWDVDRPQRASLGEIGEIFDITRGGKSLLDSQRNICCQTVNLVGNSLWYVCRVASGWRSWLLFRQTPMAIKSIYLYPLSVRDAPLVNDPLHLPQCSL